MQDGNIKIVVLPQTVPTTASPFHPSATHIDALGMPVAFNTIDWHDGTEPETYTYLPTPCCGAAASCGEWGMYCKACYEEVDMAYGNVPTEPFRPIAAATREP